MIAQIFIKDMVAQFHVGEHAEERDVAQPIVINVVCEVDIGRSILTDDIRDTVDYVFTYEAIHRLALERSFCLIETLADTVAGLALADKRVRRTEVTIEKPRKLVDCAAVGLTICKVRT